jgi:hypothetical protein
MVPVLVGRDDRVEPPVAQLDECGGLVGCVDQDPAARRTAGQQVAVVRHLRVDRELRDG